jgi:hypothetical protein
MELIQIFPSISDNKGKAFPFRKFEQFKERLVNKFGGVTAFLNSPGEGMWREAPENFIKDNVVTLEVMSETLDRDWWNDYKEELETGFGQEEIVSGKIPIEIL